MSDIDLISSKPDPATPKQLAYLRALSEQHDDTAMVAAMPPQWKYYYHAVLNGDDNIAKTDASKFITELLKCPKQKLMQLPPIGSEAELMVVNDLAELAKYPQCGPLGDPRTDVAELQDGMYLIPGRHGEAGNAHIPDTFYKVYHTVHGNNIQVAKRLVIVKSGTLTKSGANDGPLEAKVKFVYEGRKPLQFLTPAMRLTIEQAKEFGALYGTCCICGRTLTNELSIHIGIGPICGRRQFGGEFEFQINQAKLELGMPAKDDSYEYGMSATGAPLSKQELEARLAEINQELGQ